MLILLEDCIGSRCIGFSLQHSYWMWLTDRQTD